MSRYENEIWMRECLRLAKIGVGSVSPNPLVGAVIVLNGKVVGKAFHAKFGGPHAEVRAIRNALRRHSSLRGATLYVNLEPCAHHGKTPPCVKAIVAQGISKVVAAIKDPNPRVAGRGFKLLRASGVKVVTGVLADEAEKLNEKFSKYITTDLPFVALKVAQTSDGFVATINGASKWITAGRSRQMVHALRAEYDGVLVGAGTIISDNPHLTVRHVRGRNPQRIVLDGRLRSPLDAHVFNDRERKRTIIFSDRTQARKAGSFRKRGVKVILMKCRNGAIPVGEILTNLGRRGIASILVEGGPTTYRSFLNAAAVDKMYVFTSPKRFGEGLPAFGPLVRAFGFRDKKKFRLAGDTLVEGRVVFRAGG